MSEVETSLDSGVLRILINRENKRNAMSADVLRALVEAMVAASQDSAVRVVVLTGAGDRFFCAGADLSVMGAEAAGLAQHAARGQLARLVLAMRDCPVPVVARVQGLCLAGGLALALGSDVVLAKDTVEFAMPEIDRGLWPFMVSALLARQVAAKHAMDRMLIGDRFDAATAYGMGLVSRVFPADSFDQQVDSYVAKLAESPPQAVRLGKQAWISATETGPLAVALDAMQAQLSLLTTSDDAAEGVAAFFEKRSPTWTGR
jgi:enoyl-CoA hydratase